MLSYFALRDCAQCSKRAESSPTSAAFAATFTVLRTLWSRAITL
jgi:hypothetical protein